MVKGPGSGREAAIRSLQAAGLEVSLIKDVTPPNFLVEIREAASRGEFRTTGPAMETYRAWLPRAGKAGEVRTNGKAE